MSTQYPGGFITKSPVAPTTTAASGIWTVDQALQYVKAGTWPSPPIFIEDLFSTYLYTGNGSTQTITNNVNLSTGGMVWLKSRSSSVYNHFLIDTARGVQSELSSNNADFANTATPGYDLTAFTSTGFTLGPVDKSGFNNNGSTQVSWSFKKQPKFFDIVTYTGTGANQNIAHSLGSVPGCIIVKQIAPNSTNWQVYHRSLANTQYMVLNGTAAVATGATRWNSTTPTASVFSVGTDATVNTASSTYVAYLFAHDAGGFPANGGGSTNGISCGSFSFAAGKATVNLGYEVQYLLMKRYDTAGDQWWVFDVMRGMTASLTGNRYLGPNTTLQEDDLNSITQPTATGFYLDWANNGITTGNYIYIAIRRGPMKTPTVGTSVFAPITGSLASGSSQSVGFVADSSLVKWRTGTDNSQWYDRLRLYKNSNTSSANQFLSTDSTNAESTLNQTPAVYNAWNTTVLTGGYFAGTSTVFYHFGRAPGFFDVVCYTGTGVAGLAVNHNLGVAPEMMIIKRRNTAWAWAVYYGVTNQYLVLNTTAATASDTLWNSSLQTASVFTLGDPPSVNNTGSTYVAYLFATCAGVSKVGSYTGDGTVGRVINCGFTSGARFIMLKKTSTTSDWYVYDTARGITTGGEKSLSLNTTAAESGSSDVIDPDSSGFAVGTGASDFFNELGVTYIYLAIA